MRCAHGIGAVMASLSSRPWIDTVEFCRRGSTLSARQPAGEFQRLTDLLASSDGELGWVLSGERRQRPEGGSDSFLRLVLDAKLSVRCDRCLQPMPFSLHEERLFKLALTETMAEREDRDADDYDVLVGSARFDVLELVEDEAIMGLPIAPRHSVCDLPEGQMAPHPSNGALSPARENPFAVLASLKRGSRKDGEAG
jgi:uncharacterized protein